MSLVYMKALEKDPQTYDLEFKKQFPEANFIYDLIKSRIGQEGRVLEIGCGSGRLAIDMAKRGLDVVGIDVSEKMIEHARATSKEENVDLTFLTGNFISLAILKHLENSGPFDFIISTFALSEFTPLQQELFLKQMSKLLNRQGVCYLAADTAPISGLARVRYSIKNFISAQISIFKDIPSTSPVINLEGKLKPYFKSTQIFQAKSVKLFEITNRSDDSAAHAENQDLKSTLGHFSQLKTGYCIVNGILTRKSIKPGLYRVGNPKNNSPLLVTANYYWTVNSVYNIN